MDAQGMANDYTKIKAVTFDAAHTLFHPYPSVGAIYREVMLRHGLDFSQAELEAGFQRAFSHTFKDKTILDGEQRERSYWHSVVMESIRDFSSTPDDFESLFGDLWDEFAHGSRWRPAEGAKETLKVLKRKGLTIALLTNWDSRVRNVLSETGFAELFDHLFISSEIGFEKPDLEIFRHAENTVGFPPNEILHIGDSLQHDIEGARNAGWQAMRIVSAPKAPQECPSIIRLTELTDLL